MIRAAKTTNWDDESYIHVGIKNVYDQVVRGQRDEGMKDFTDEALAISVGKLLQRGTLQTLA